MPEYSEEQIEEMVCEALAKKEKSFGGTFKRLKSENEELGRKASEIQTEYESAKTTMSQRIDELETLLAENRKHVSELAVKSELYKQLRDAGPLPEKFIDWKNIEYSDDPEQLGAQVSREIERGRKSLEQVLKDIGIPVQGEGRTTANPTNPPSRDTITARDMKKAGTKDVLNDMVHRGLIR